MVDPQKFYDDTIAHILKQGRAISSDPDETRMCLYRTFEGKKCAAGLHIPDHLYDGKMEGKPIDCVLVSHPHLREFFPESLPLVQALQRLHDDSNEIFFKDDEMTALGRKHVRDIACSYGLNPFDFDASR